MKQSFFVLSLTVILLFVFLSESNCQLPLPSPPKCSKASSKEIDLYDCKRYWQCKNGEARNIECPGKLNFDHYTRVSVKIYAYFIIQITNYEYI